MSLPKLAGLYAQLRRCSLKRCGLHDPISRNHAAAHQRGSGNAAPLCSRFDRSLHTSRQSMTDQFKRYGPAAEASLKKKRKERLAREEDARNAGRAEHIADKPEKDASANGSRASEREAAARQQNTQGSGFQLVGQDTVPEKAANGTEADKEAFLDAHTDGDALNGVFLSSKLTREGQAQNEQNNQSDHNNEETPDSLALLQHKNHPEYSKMVSSPYVHHFDTHTLVQNLEKGGFTENQSILIMKGIRGILADNLRLSDKELVSKSDLENESYLFKAACSELHFSITASRALEIEAQRTRRAQLQHELDILTQRMGQDFIALRDDLKEMFNNQKISTRELQRSIDTSIQELNYQITVSLNSDGKSTVEGLRWILTRRAAIAIATSAFMIILALRFHSYQANAPKEPEQPARPVPPAGHNRVGEPVSVLESEPMG